MEQVKKTHEPILITKRGEVIAQLTPPSAESKKPWLVLRGTGKISGDIVAPAMSDAEIDAFTREEISTIWNKPRGRRSAH